MTATRETAVALWGEDAVALALADPNPDAVDLVLASTIAEQARALGDVGFARWAVREPWLRFCAIVRLCAGVTRADLLR